MGSYVSPDCGDGAAERQACLASRPPIDGVPLVVVFVIVVRRADLQERRSHLVSSGLDEADLPSLIFGQHTTELLDSGFDLDDVLIREQTAPDIQLASIEGRAEMKQSSRIAVLGERTGAELHVVQSVFRRIAKIRSSRTPMPESTLAIAAR